MCRDKCWLSFALTLPVAFWSAHIEELMGYRAPEFPGSSWLPPVLATAIFLCGGLVFLQGAWRELRARLPGMMALISLAGPAHAIAQSDHAPIRVEMPQSAPNISRVAVGDGSVCFWDRFGFLGDAYAYDRRRKNFARVKLPADVMALGRVKTVALEFFFRGDRKPVTIPIESLQTDTSGYAGESLAGPTGLYVDSLRHLALHPFFPKALKTRVSYEHVEIATLLVEWADTGSVPDLRESLYSTEYPSNARIATALALLGDSAGLRRIRRALGDTLRQSASLDSAERIHHHLFESAGKVRDPASVPRLLDLLPDERYGFGAANALIAYESVGVMRRAFAVLARSGDGSAIPLVLGRIAGDTSAFVMKPALRDSARMIARRIMAGPPTRTHEAATAVLVRYADVSDLPHLIGALTVNESSYGAAVIALVRLAGTGVDVMPVGTGTLAQRAAAQQWWMDWFMRTRATFRPTPKEVADRAVSAMYGKLRR